MKELVQFVTAYLATLGVVIVSTKYSLGISTTLTVHDPRRLPDFAEDDAIIYITDEYDPEDSRFLGVGFELDDKFMSDPDEAAVASALIKKFGTVVRCHQDNKLDLLCECSNDRFDATVAEQIWTRAFKRYYAAIHVGPEERALTLY